MTIINQIRNESISARSTIIEGKPAKLHILDTAGESVDTSRRNEHLLWGEGFLLVYCVSDLASFYHIMHLADTIVTLRGSKPTPCVLVANKADVCQEAWQISEEQGRRLASRLNCPYVETSAREQYSSVVHAFSALFHEVKLHQKKDRMRTMSRKSNSTISQLKETLRSLTDFRHRTNTF